MVGQGLGCNVDLLGCRTKVRLLCIFECWTSFRAFQSGGVRSTAGFLGSTFSFKVVECVEGGF